MKITFINTLGIPEEFSPKPSSKHIPDWYKDLDSYMDKDKKPNGSGVTSATIKRCMPVFDSINSGYIIPTPCDIWITQKPLEENSNKTQPFYEWPGLTAIEFHPIIQAPNHPSNKGHEISYPKWTNPWGIKTPPGYSVMFVQPWHRESVFTILPGVVDTDKYSAPVNFPFVLNDIKFEGLIPAGTPMAQVIPFKRDSWKMETDNKKEVENQKMVTNLLKTRIFDSYKTYFRQNKEYR
jgi:hypothetical protein